MKSQRMSARIAVREKPGWLILPPEQGIDSPGRSDPEAEGHWKLDRIPHDFDRQGFRGWDAADVVITLLEPTDAKSSFLFRPVIFLGWYQARMLWLAVRALGLGVQPAHKS